MSFRRHRGIKKILPGVCFISVQFASADGLPLQTRFLLGDITTDLSSSACEFRTADENRKWTFLARAGSSMHDGTTNITNCFHELEIIKPDMRLLLNCLTVSQFNWTLPVKLMIATGVRVWCSNL